MIRKVDTVFQAVVIVGAVTLIVFQAFVHIAVNVGLLPVTGQTLPLISKGGTSIMVMGMLFGLILGMSRKIEEKDESTENTTDTPQEPTDKETETNDTDLAICTEEEQQDKETFDFIEITNTNDTTASKDS